MTGAVAQRCYLYRFFDAEERLLYVGITRDLCARIAAHRRGSVWWDEAVRGTTVVYPSRVGAELAVSIAIHSEHSVHNRARPTEEKIARLHVQAEIDGHDVTRLVAEVERLRELIGVQRIGLVRMRGNLDAARHAYRSMRAKYLAAETQTSFWSRKYFKLNGTRNEPVPVPPDREADWGEL